MPNTETLFPGFREHRTGPIFARVGGSGPPLLLLHGYPQTGAMWHKIAPGLAEEHTVVVADLLGYGASDSPPGDSGGEAYSKRTMAQCMVDLMADLGFDTFSLAGHDRGGRVSYRLALDHPERVERLSLLDIVPTAEQFEQMGIAGGLGGFHWYFLAQPAPLPETLINGAPEFFSQANAGQLGRRGRPDRLHRSGDGRVSGGRQRPGDGAQLVRGLSLGRALRPAPRPRRSFRGQEDHLSPCS